MPSESGAAHVRITFIAYDSRGEVLKIVSPGPGLGPGEKLVVYASELFGEPVSRATAWLSVESDNGGLVGVGLMGTSERLFSVEMK